MEHRVVRSNFFSWISINRKMREIKSSKFLLLYNTLRKIIVYELASTFDAIFSYRFTFTEKRYTWTLHLEIMDLDSMVARKFH